MNTAEIITFGCRLNAYESEVMRQHARRAGLGDVVVVHTCAVTGEAERQARQAIRRARREQPARRVIVTGCAAQIDPTGFGAMPEVDAVIGNAEKLDPTIWHRLAGNTPPQTVVSDIMAARETAHHLVEGFEGRTRAFLQVQQGCDHRCTFCIIPFGRGPNQSVPVGEVVSQARQLVEAGYREVVLTGVDITSYGRDLPGGPTLGQLVRRLLRLVPDLARLRLSSLDPAAIDAELLRLLGDEPRLMPHLHLSVQAGDTLTLKRMKRRHDRNDVVRLTRTVRSLRPEVAFGADLIAGFPTETEAMFQNTLDLVVEADLSFLHVFPYSPRPGTPAARMPAVPKSERKDRAARLRAEGRRALGRRLQHEVGRPSVVLAETDGTGRTETFAPVRIETDAPPPGTLVRVVPGRIEGDTLIGCAA